jgi:hypothetical protein
MVGLLLFAQKKFVIAFGTEFVFPAEVTVVWADGERRCDGQIGDVEILQGPSYQFRTGPVTADPFVHIEMEYGSAGIFSLQGLLMLQCSERVVSKAYRSWDELV